jgi:hypothetical protein
MFFSFYLNIHFTNLLFFFAFSSCWAKESEDKDFYALASLRYYLESREEDEKIEFTPDEVESLWKSAAHSPFAQQIFNAKALYKSCAEMPQATSDQNLKWERIKKIVKNVWLKRNIQLLKSECSNDKSVNHIKSFYPNFDGNPAINDPMQRRMRPYLLPLNHPIKPSLDGIFCHATPLVNETSFVKAGFTVRFSQPFSFIRVASHPELPDYLVKTYLEDDLRLRDNKESWKWLYIRCKGAESIRKIIERKKLRHFVVPNKWLYPLPYQEFQRHPVLLLVDDMKLASRADCEYAWKHITKEHLDELFCILSHGYASTYLCENIPYTMDNKFACIDTEHVQRDLCLSHVGRYLSQEMEEYWNKLVRSGGRS